MDSESPKPYSWFSRFVSSLSWLLPATASTLNPLNHSSNTDQQNHPQTDEPEGPEPSISVYSTKNQDDSEDLSLSFINQPFPTGNPNTPNPEHEVELSPFPQAEMETQDELGIITNSIPSYPRLQLSILERLDSSSSSLLETFSRIQEDGNDAESASPSPTSFIDSPMPFHYQMQTTTPLNLQYSPNEESASPLFDSFSTKDPSRDGVNLSSPQPSSIGPKQSPIPKISPLVGLHSSPPQPSIATKENPNPKISTKVKKLQSNEVRVLISKTEEQKADAPHPVLEIIDKQELGKHVLVLAIPMVMGFVVTSNPLAKSVEMQAVAITLCGAFAAIFNGVLLRTSHRTASTLLLVGGIALMMSAFYAFMGCFLPLKLKWIPGLCWLASLFPLAKILLSFFGWEKVAGEENDLEKGKINNDKP